MTGTNETSSSAIAETALQGGLVMAKSGRLEQRDNIYGQYIGSTTATYLASKEIESAKKRKIRAVTPFKVIQGHPRSSRSVPIESPYATSYHSLHGSAALL